MSNGSKANEMSSSDASKPSQLVSGADFFVGLVIGIILASLFFSFIADVSRNKGIADSDADGVPDSHDLLPKGDAGVKFTIATIEHAEYNESITVNLSITYDGNGDPSGNSDNQWCNFTITIEANTSTTSPGDSCTFTTSDWTILGVGFGYSMDHEVEEDDETLRNHWDLFSGTSDDTAGYNSSIDAFLLYSGQTIVLDGLDDGDSHQWNARLTLVTSPEEL